MLQTTPQLSPPRSFFSYTALLAAAGLVVGALVLSPDSFRITLDISLSITFVASGFATRITEPWSVSQRALLLVAIGSLSVAVGMIGRFVF